MRVRTYRRTKLVQRDLVELGVSLLVTLGIFALILNLLPLAQRTLDFPNWLEIVLSLVVTVIGLGAAGLIIRRLYYAVAHGSSVAARVPAADALAPQSEGKFKALIQNSLDLITIIDRGGKVIYQSPSCERILGYPPEELTGQSIYDLIASEDHCLIENAIEQRNSSFLFSFRMQHHDGSWLYFESVGTDMQHNHDVNGIVLNSRDVSDRIRQEEEKKQKEIAAMRLNIEKEQAQHEKDLIEKSKQQLEAAYAIIEQANHEIRDSINYAFRIQSTFFPAIDSIHHLFPDSFVFWRPKDIVSGDFYWFTQRDGLYFLTAADCTGHGVPGAFMTIIGVTLLNQIILQHGVTLPNEILSRLHKEVQRTLKQSNEDMSSRDGMDLALVVLEPATQKLYFAGANNPLLLVRNGESSIYKADKRPIGGVDDLFKSEFVLHEIEYQKGDVLYMYSDGYQDQFGGEHGKKFKSSRFVALLSEISSLPMRQQPKILESTLNDWLGDTHEQVDDILVLSVKL